MIQTVENISRAFNVEREKNIGKEFTREEIVVQLMFIFSLGKPSLGKLLPRLEKTQILLVKKVGTKKLYQYPTTPIYKDKFAKVLNDLKNSFKQPSRRMSEETMIDILKRKGYVVMKPSKLNLDKVKEVLGDKLNSCYDYEVC